MHDPAVPPVTHADFEQYKKSTAPTINHFYEKLLHLKDRLHTPAARQLAARRHQFMEEFLTQFLAEWDSTDVVELRPVTFISEAVKG